MRHKREIARMLRSSGLLWLLRDRVSRQEVVQWCVDDLKATTYLEIGVSDGECFCAVSAPIKIGVDPIAPSPAVLEETRQSGVTYCALPSDEFFRGPARGLLTAGVDVAFIDGLHTWHQAYRDCRNVLRYLSPEGVILLHDCLPRNEQEATVAASHSHAAELNGPGWNGVWTGDVWRVIVTLRTYHTDLSAHVLWCDHGIGLVRRTRRPSRHPLAEMDISGLTFADLRADKRRLLGLARPAYLPWTVKSRRLLSGLNAAPHLL